MTPSHDVHLRCYFNSALHIYIFQQAFKIVFVEIKNLYAFKFPGILYGKKLLYIFKVNFPRKIFFFNNFFICKYLKLFWCENVCLYKKDCSYFFVCSQINICINLVSFIDIYPICVTKLGLLLDSYIAYRFRGDKPTKYYQIFIGVIKFLGFSLLL